jgi:hypothetical protein
MPKMSREEIKALVDKGEVLAITIDTSIFDKFGCNLQYKSLTAVEQFKEKHIDFLLSPVTAGEVKSHISKAITEAAAKAQSGINQFFKATRSVGDLPATLKALGLDVDPAEEADEMFAAYIERVGASIITQQVSSDDLLRLYFDAKPPFGRSSEKKSEFPDAIALLALERWASENDTLIIAVSRDGDWESFAHTSQRVICLQDLPIALGLFNDQESVIAARVAAAIKAGSALSLGRVIETRLQGYIDEFDVDANSAFNYEYEVNGAAVARWDYDNPDEIAVVASSDEQVVISFDLKVEADFEASFGFSVRDSIDRDYVNLGSSLASVRHTFTVTAVATFDKSSDRDPEPSDLEIEGRGITVDFGSVDPDWD